MLDIDLHPVPFTKIPEDGSKRREVPCLVVTSMGIGMRLSVEVAKGALAWGGTKRAVQSLAQRIHVMTCEHIIHSEAYLQNKKDYIESNPPLWEEDDENPIDVEKTLDEPSVFLFMS